MKEQEGVFYFTVEELVTVSELFRTPGMIDQVAQTGKRLVLTRCGRPVAALVPLSKLTTEKPE